MRVISGQTTIRAGDLVWLKILRAQKPVTRKHVARKEREQKQIKSAVIVTGVIIGLALILLAYVLVDNYFIQPNRVVARVGDMQIKAGDFEANVTYSRLNLLTTANQYAYYAQLFGESGSQFKSEGINLIYQLNNTEQIGENVLNEMIDDKLIREEAAKRGISVTEEELQESLQKFFRFYPNGTKTPTITPTIVNTPWSREQFRLINPTETATPEPTATSTPEGWEPWKLLNLLRPLKLTLPQRIAPLPQSRRKPRSQPDPNCTVYTTKLFRKEIGKYLDELKTYGISQKQIEEIFRSNLFREKLMEDVTKDLLPEEEQVWVRHISSPTRKPRRKSSINSIMAETGLNWHPNILPTPPIRTTAETSDGSVPTTTSSKSSNKPLSR